MEPLKSKSCEACRVGAPTVPADEITELMEQLPGWGLIEQSSIPQLQKQFTFTNFMEALAFTQAVGEMAEAEGHHPALLTEWGSVEVRWWTHKIKGLHQNDFICAAKTDSLYASK